MPPNPWITFTWTGNGSGSVTANGAPLGGPGELLMVEVEAWSTIVFTAEPGPGYRVADWTISGGTLLGGDLVRTLSSGIHTNLTVSVTFESETCQCTTWVPKFIVPREGVDGSSFEECSDCGDTRNVAPIPHQPIGFLIGALIAGDIFGWQVTSSALQVELTNLMAEGETLLANHESHSDATPFYANVGLVNAALARMNAVAQRIHDILQSVAQSEIDNARHFLDIAIMGGEIFGGGARQAELDVLLAQGRAMLADPNATAAQMRALALQIEEIARP
jgi:hypothetical protein